MSEVLRTSELRRGLLGSCVLALLNERPRYGLELVRDLTAAGGLLTSGGTVYPLLSRLSDQGLVEGRWTSSTSTSTPPRLNYSLTPSGEEYLRASRQEWLRFRTVVDGVLVQSSEPPVNARTEEKP